MSVLRDKHIVSLKGVVLSPCVAVVMEVGRAGDASECFPLYLFHSFFPLKSISLKFSCSNIPFPSYLPLSLLPLLPPPLSQVVRQGLFV